MGPDSYLWRVEGKAVRVQLSLAVVERLAEEIVGLQRRGEDGTAFGLLLGRSKRERGGRVTLISDYEPINMARLRGKPQPPEGCDGDVVGLYHSRPAADLRLDHLDAALIRSSFDHPGMVYLAIDPAESPRAAFFIQEDGDVHGYRPYLEFKFNADALRLSGPVAGFKKKPPPVIAFAAAGTAALAVATAVLFFMPSSGASSAVNAPPAQSVPQPAAASTVEPQSAPVPAPHQNLKPRKSSQRKTKSERKRRRASAETAKRDKSHVTAKHDASVRSERSSQKRGFRRLLALMSARKSHSR